MNEGLGEKLEKRKAKVATWPKEDEKLRMGGDGGVDEVHGQDRVWFLYAGIRRCGLQSALARGWLGLTAGNSRHIRRRVSVLFVRDIVG